ncbi:hypothetical protein KFL_001560130 [Klebsormidium nitens]|uniref:Uncharacterized protein n=1 Tax=Klebsormidium nitens TaxID=105231 RepID=A0A1Y1HYB4_KLENI|nr:hypothetical protein KFL_001560130 [Klebsormidium nitens]|eukprot:GAQ83644.1 hypothetical protein KFL_001560130 [Klebsormidium nitens]
MISSGNSMVLRSTTAFSARNEAASARGARRCEAEQKKAASLPGESCVAVRHALFICPGKRCSVNETVTGHG